MAAPYSPRPRGRRRNPVRSVGGVVLLVIVLAMIAGAGDLIRTQIDKRRYPWADRGSGRPTLTGMWMGTLVTGGGARRAILLDLRFNPGNSSGRRRRSRSRSRRLLLQGEVRMCGGQAEQRFTLTGNNQDKAATRFYVSLSATDSTPPDGLAPSHLRGRWNGQDSLVMEADMHLRRGESAITSSNDPHTGRPATLHMTRGNDAAFRARCAQLR